MPVDLVIESVPEDLAKRLRAQAVRNRRSLRDELLAILQEAAPTPAQLTASEVLAEIRRLGLETPAESADMIRADRDAR